MPNENAEGSQNPSTEDPQTPEPKSSEPNLGNLVNSAVTAQLRRFAEKQLPSMLESAIKPLTEQLAALKAAPPPPPPEEDSKKKVSPEVAALTQQLEDMKAALKNEAESRALAEKKAREDRVFSDFKGHLAKSVRPEMLDVIANHLFHVQKMVEIDDSGSATFKGTRTNYGITEEIAYPLKDGVDNWLKSEDAKPYLPAPGTSNTPTTRRTVVSNTGLPKDFDLSKATPEQKLQYAEQLEQEWGSLLAKS